MCGGAVLLREVFDSIHSRANLPTALSDPSVERQLRDSLLLRRFVFHMAEESAKRVTGDHNKPQGTMGRVQTAGEAPARSCVVFLARPNFWSF